MNNEVNEKNKGIFFGIVGVATLIISIIGATFAYFTATQTVDNQISGNAATISFLLEVDVMVDGQDQGGMIPMTNGMAEAAVASNNGACVDDNGNAVCQIYKITLTNSGTASMFLDGYVNLTGGAPGAASQSPTNMRWVQVFHTGSDMENGYTVGGTPALASGATGISALALQRTGQNNIDLNTEMSQSNYSFGGNSYTYISNNYMRTSGHGAGNYSRNDTTNALVFNQYLAPASDATNKTRDLFIAVWLSETGTNQNLSGNENNFFTGTVTFNSASGGEVSAVFGGYTRNPKTA